MTGDGHPIIYLAVLIDVTIGDLCSLGANPVAEYADDGVFIGAPTINGFVQSLGIAVRIERRSRIERRCVLKPLQHKSASTVKEDREQKETRWTHRCDESDQSGRQQEG